MQYKFMQRSLCVVLLMRTLNLTGAACPGASKCAAPPGPAPGPAPASAPSPGGAASPSPGSTPSSSSGAASNRASAIIFLLLALAFTMGDAQTTEVQKVDCEGTVKDSACYGGVKCLAGNVSVVKCPQVPIDLDWEYKVPKAKWTTATRKTHAREIPMIVCPIGSKVSFNWKGTVHDVYQLPSEEAYNTCTFLKGVNVKDASSSDAFEFHCDTVGTHYFACSVGDACSSGAQKVRVYVTDPVKTLKLRATGGMSLEEFNIKYTLNFVGYFNNKQILSLNNADQALLDAKSVIAQSPESCSDWIPESWNTDQNCQAFVYTDLGFLSRARPDPDFEASENYYKKALQISPGMCGATSYLAELRVQQDRKSDADTLYVQSCQACGQDSMDFHDLVLAYENRSWAPPNCTSTPSISEGVPSGASPRPASFFLYMTSIFLISFTWSSWLQ